MCSNEELRRRLEHLEVKCEGIPEILTAVNEIKREMVGNNEFGGFGYKQRLQKVEEKTKDLEKFKNKVLGWVSGAAAIVTTAVNVIMELFRNANPN